MNPTQLDMSVLPVQTLGAMVKRTVDRYGSKVSHMLPVKGGYESLTYDQVFERIFQVARSLSSLGVKRGDRLVILGETGFDWAVVDWAAQTLGIVTVPIYPTLPADQAQFIAEDCGAVVAVCGDATLAGKLAGIDTVLFHSTVGWRSLADPVEGTSLTREAWLDEISKGDGQDIATIIYTSGTTGNPKGVMLRHESFVSLSHAIEETVPIYHSDVFLSWLPLSHVFERYAGHCLPMYLGATVAYSASVTTLSNDMLKVNPTVVLCVPRFLDSVRSRIVDTVRKKGGIEEKLFDLALSQGLARQQGKFAPLAGILDKVVGSKIRARLGSRLRFLVSGGAALPPQITNFYLAFGITVLQGYGLTETTAASALNMPDDNDPETVGPLIRGVEGKIAADGEILLRGPAVMAGYYNLPAETAAAIDAEGWFHTGDIGEFVGDKLKITDRKKDLLVLGNGKNVAPQPIENKLKESEYISEAVLLGDGMEHCAALIVPDFDHVKTWLSSRGSEIVEPMEMVELFEVKDLIAQEVKRANQQLADFERVKRHALLGKAFSVDDGELTPSLKVKRRVVKERYSDEISRLTKG